MELYCIFAYIFMLGSLVESEEILSIGGIVTLIVAPIWFPYVLGRGFVRLLNK